tara:strand:+ start:97 stop:312 length:216 start_codon:yes stop_codon:yes gene_type:complete
MLYGTLLGYVYATDVMEVYEFGQIRNVCIAFGVIFTILGILFVTLRSGRAGSGGGGGGCSSCGGGGCGGGD